jgi:hypothetical protein
MFEPITLFIAIDGASLIAALILTISSGSEVAKATTVIPITSFDILSFKESATEDLIINSPPMTNNIKPINIHNKFMLSKA